MSRYLRINECKSKHHRKKLSPNCKQRHVTAALLVWEWSFQCARKAFSSQQGVWKSHNRMFGKFQIMYFHNRFIQVEMGRGNMKKCSLTLWIWLYFNVIAEICDGCEFNYFQLIANFFENDNHSITVLCQHGVLPNSVKCPKCNKLCLLRQDKWQWRCTGSVKDKKH